VTNFSLLDSSRELANDEAYVRFLESVNADKSLWCRLRLSVKQLMNYLLLIITGDCIHSNYFGIVAAVLNGDVKTLIFKLYFKNLNLPFSMQYSVLIYKFAVLAAP